MNLQNYNVPNKIQIRTKEGLEFTSRVIQYCYPEDNEGFDKESLIVETDKGDLYNLYDDDIEEIKILE
ncbi:hypothetical protein [uncultured Dubosiella sp.]|uniref:hypothetical protein n=1 Tax=uncultured Dubosiella sp. TaxID=1937011 RepID=UPI0025B47C5F|nr:hypothetical protein [uncultured Dubosiella sp.]